MMKKTFWLCLFLGLMAQNVTAQKTAEQQIVALKNGVLIVNLIVPQHKIDALNASGKKAEADKMMLDAERTNNNLISAFANYYTFGKVLFVYSFDIEKMTSGDGSVLFDAQNNRQTQVPGSFFVADLSGSPERNMEGLVLKDDTFTVLKKPFPYFISAWEIFHFKRLTEAEMVARLNKKLLSFYAKVSPNR